MIIDEEEEVEVYGKIPVRPVHHLSIFLIVQLHNGPYNVPLENVHRYFAPYLHTTPVVAT